MAVPLPDPSGGEATSNDHAACGLREAMACVRGRGGDASPLIGKIPDNAWAVQIQNAINGIGQGFHAEAVWQTPLGLLASVVPQEKWVIVSVWCNYDATPINGPLRVQNPPSHWIAAYAADSSHFNCWEQTYDRVADLDACYDSRVGCVVVWRDPQPAPPPPPPLITGGTDVLIVFQKGTGLFLSNLMCYRYLGTPQEVTDDILLGKEAGGYVDQHVGPVADLRAFGLPMDNEAKTVANDPRAPIIH